VRRNITSPQGIAPMTALIAGRNAARDLIHEVLVFLRALILADTAKDASSTGFCWPRGL
jgi:hypothetical protein